MENEASNLWFMITRLAEYSTTMDKRQKEFSASFKTQSIN